jgi:hypothetical protein
MELQVLQGLEQTIATHRPKIFIEVENVNLAAFSSGGRRIATGS